MATAMRAHQVGQRRGFTLVELLVVVCIIGVLVSLFAPCLAKAQRHAEQICCLSNERQLTTAWIQYAGDQGDRLCEPNQFRDRLQPYAPGNRNAYRCQVCAGIGDASLDALIGSGYGLSNALGGHTRDGVVACTQLHRITFPSERLVFVDVESEASGCFWPVLREEERWVWRPWSWPPGASLQGITARHASGCNMSFADGHAAYFRWKDPRTLQLIKGLIADSSSASSDNTDLDYMVQVLTRPFPQEGGDQNYGHSHP